MVAGGNSQRKRGGANGHVRWEFDKVTEFRVTRKLSFGIFGQIQCSFEAIWTVSQKQVPRIRLCHHFPSWKLHSSIRGCVFVFQRFSWRQNQDFFVVDVVICILKRLSFRYFGPRLSVLKAKKPSGHLVSSIGTRAVFLRVLASSWRCKLSKVFIGEEQKNEVSVVLSGGRSAGSLQIKRSSWHRPHPSRPASGQTIAQDHAGVTHEEFIVMVFMVVGC